MKILRIIYDFPPPWEGLAPFPYELTLAEAKKGLKIDVICGLWPKQLPKITNLPENVNLYRVLREPIKYTLFFTTAIYTFFLLFVLRTTNRYGAIFGHGQLPIWFNLYKFLVGKLDKTPYYFFLQITAAGREIQAKSRNEHVDFFTRQVEWPLHKLSDKWGVSSSDHIFVTGEKIKQEAINYYGAKPEKITVLENGVNTELFRPDGVNKRKNLDYQEEDKVIMFLGSITDRKNLDKLILALNILPQEYKLLVIGRGQDLYLKELEMMIIRYDLGDRIRFLGYIPYPETPMYYRCANIFVLPSSYEGFPKVVLESLACGVPVLASGFDVIKNVRGLTMLKENSQETIAQNILEHIADEVDLGEIRNTYSWSRVVEKINNITHYE